MKKALTLIKRAKNLVKKAKTYLKKKAYALAIYNAEKAVKLLLKAKSLESKKLYRQKNN